MTTPAIVIGHRGARFEAPENTIPGFRHALDLGLSAVEFDIRLTADNRLVVIHDATVDRTTDATGDVASFTLADLQRLDARSNFPGWPEPCRIPTFAEVLDVVDGLPELLIEIKEYDPARADIVVPAVIDTIRGRGIQDQVTITCFQPYPLDIARRIAPEIRRGYVGAWDAREYLDTALSLEATQIDANHVKADRVLVNEARSHGMRVVAWPTNSQEDLESVLTLEPDLFCTDAPTLLLDLYDPCTVS